MDYILAHPMKYDREVTVFQCIDEAILFDIWKSSPKKEKLSGSKGNAGRATENYPMFCVLYARILDSLPRKSAQELEALQKRKEQCLILASHAAPCNFEVWEALASVYSSQDEDKYQLCIKNTLLYCYKPGAPDGLGQGYASLALHYAAKDPALSTALCKLSRQYQGAPIAAEFILSKTQFIPPENIEEVVRKAGIQIGFSLWISLVEMQKEKLRPSGTP